MTPCGIGNYNDYYGVATIDGCRACPSGTSCPLTANVRYTLITVPAGYIYDSVLN